MRMFVANLPFFVSEQELHDCFDQWGPVERATIMRDAVGISRGFGFVDMPDAKALRAIEDLDGRDWDGRRIHVSQARPRGQAHALAWQSRT